MDTPCNYLGHSWSCTYGKSRLQKFVSSFQHGTGPRNAKAAFTSTKGCSRNDIEQSHYKGRSLRRE